jgi:Ca2+-transporting ATPase
MTAETMRTETIADSVGNRLRSGPGQFTGLSSAEAARRLQLHGQNLLPESDRRNWLRIVWSVLREPMLLLLLAATSVYLLLGDPQEAAVLGASVLLVIALTVYQEYKSERALQALRDLSSPRARVLRGGETHLVAAREVVRGDIVLVAEGDRVPADARLLDDNDLMVDESMLTGESVPVRRRVSPDDSAEDGVIRASTLVVRGHGVAEVIATGVDTAVGEIGAALRTLRTPPTPMQREIRRAVILFAFLGVGTSLLMTVLFVALRGDWLQGVLAGITLAMANIPEEFPVVLAVFLALGAWRMARHRVLIRRPPAIEALGSVTVLCTDKTGTLTENRMSVAELVFDEDRAPPSVTLPASLKLLLLCADAASPDQPFDPMEVAIKVALTHSAVSKRDGWLRIHEYPLSSDLLAVTHVWRSPDSASLQVFCKGAPEAVAGLCDLPAARRETILRDVEAMGRRGLRVIAAATARWNDDVGTLPASAHGFAFEWRGLLGLADPLRAGVREAVAEAQAAGVRVIMLTGDHLETARAIAAQAGLSKPGCVLMGRDLEELDCDALRDRILAVDVFARVKPEHKLRLVESLKQNGQVVAMTGDGVNDAPALAAAHVGVAMGERGTDVAREAASIVLLDDNFVTIVKAIRHGRTIYDNIVRAVRYILAVHVPITGLAMLPLLFGGPLILLPLHVVFLELIIDPASTLVFEREPAAEDVMRRPPRSPTHRLLDLRTLLGSLAQGLVVFVIVAIIYALGRVLDLPAPQLAALSFTALVTGNLGLIVVNRAAAAKGRWWRQKNSAFWVVVLSAITTLTIVTWFEVPAQWFRFAPPPPGLWGIAVLMPLSALGLIEAWHAIRRRVSAPHAAT